MIGMDDDRFARVLVVVVVAVGLLGLFGAGSFDSITGAVTRMKTATSDMDQNIDAVKAQCDAAKIAYDDGCAQIITGSGVLRPVGSNCPRLKNDVSRQCGTYERIRKAVTADLQLRGTNTAGSGEWLTGGAVADVEGTEETGAGNGVPWSLVLVAGAGLFLYFRRRQTR